MFLKKLYKQYSYLGRRNLHLIRLQGRQDHGVPLQSKSNLSLNGTSFASVLPMLKTNDGVIKLTKRATAMRFDCVANYQLPLSA